MRPLRVFLCHSSNDKPAVRELYQKLRAETWIQPWLDEEELYPGQDWNMEIEKAVEAADAILVCLSKGSITKEGYVQRELRSVLDFADYKPEGTLYIIPVRLEECEPPRRLRSWQYADYFEGQRDRAFQRLLVSLKRRADALALMDTESERNQIEESERREAERAAREKLEFEIAEKIRLEKLEREKVQQKEAADAAKIVRERLERETAKKNRLEKAQREEEKREAKKKASRERNPALQINFRLLGLGAIILTVILFIFLGGKNIFNKNIFSTKTPNLYTSPIKVSEKDGMTLINIPAGSFLMGSYEEADEQPIESIDLASFLIDQTEVSNTMYEKCVSDGKCDPPNDSYYFENENYANYPVVQVSWNDAVAYCSWANRRLPTEAEWEKAARGPSGNLYPWGSQLPTKDLLNYNKNIGAAVETRKYSAGQSFYGVYDMSGNVWEWVSSLYKPYPYDSTDGRENMDSSVGTRVFRGGSWKDADIYVRSANRGLEFPTVTNFSVGFRCAVSP